jgi:hypothetical protein
MGHRRHLGLWFGVHGNLVQRRYRAKMGAIYIPTSDARVCFERWNVDTECTDTDLMKMLVLND